MWSGHVLSVLLGVLQGFFDAKVGVTSEVNDMFGKGWVNGTVSVKVSLRNRDKEDVAYRV